MGRSILVGEQQRLLRGSDILTSDLEGEERAPVKAEEDFSRGR